MNDFPYDDDGEPSEPIRSKWHISETVTCLIIGGLAVGGWFAFAIFWN